MFYRFSNRFYYETKFMDEDLPLWIWDTETNREFYTYEYKWILGFTRVAKKATKDYSNNLFKPAEWFTSESTPNYFVVDLYGISAGGYGAYRNHKRTHSWGRVEYIDWYSSGGSGAVIYLANAKIRIKDENLNGITYEMYGKAAPVTPTGGDFDWDVSPANDYQNTNNWCLRLAEPAQTPTGIAPAGFKIIGIASGGNAYTSGSENRPGNGGAAFYIPEQCAFPADIDTLPKYEQDAHFTVGQWFNYDNKAYKCTTEFTVSNWATDSRYAVIAKTYDKNTTFNVGEYLYLNDNLYKTDKQFKGDYQNTILGFADYFLDKSEISTRFTANGRNGLRVKNSPHAVSGVEPDRFFTERDINNVNEIWVRQSLTWGGSQGIGGGRQGIGGQGGGMVLIYKGESA